MLYFLAGRWDRVVSALVGDAGISAIDLVKKRCMVRPGSKGIKLRGIILFQSFESFLREFDPLVFGLVAFRTIVLSPGINAAALETEILAGFKWSGWSFKTRIRALSSKLGCGVFGLCNLRSAKNFYFMSRFTSCSIISTKWSLNWKSDSLFGHFLPDICLRSALSYYF